MKAVIQRVKEASVIADGAFSGACKQGLFILLGIAQGDTDADALALAEKIAKLRIFSDENGKMNLSCQDIDGEALVVSNFTLNANYAKGNRPDYFGSAHPEIANALYEKFVSYLREKIRHVGTGVFGADMQISTICDGPVTICMDSEVLNRGSKK